ncbi:CmpA/NrtA family ABC transporter substrate-binding protein [Merismopedia glauca]|uniref:Bicarbonate-binding protein n=1 Tax=Merismopedia glauca CCAP 1448/3 TaxID=1296344 RepID=A0A2T1C9Z1_9CYAN|nr:CmpA/NrtA family ABC transporter substrate-binding protein [Merismopedia glauca]PSB05076.1 bicarbonate-binding protein [Merismopedia glauca CCAP 1448/3]
MNHFASKFSRRQFLLSSGAAALGTIVLHGCTDSPNQYDASDTIKIGFLGQTDAAPLIIAQVKGLFAKHGVPNVTLVKQPSWGVTRDNLQLGSKGGGIDGAMVLSPMPYQMALGTATVNRQRIPMYLLARLNTGGQGFSISNEYKGLGTKLDTSVLREKVQAAKSKGNHLRFAMTFKGGTSDLMLRYWLAAGGIDPVQDVGIITVPGPQLVSNMRVKNIDGFCVGDPFHVRLINQELGYTAATTNEFWSDHPEKALAFHGKWVDKNPQAAKGILKGLIEAQQWCDRLVNRTEMAQILSEPDWAKVPVEDISDRLQGRIIYGDDRPVAENSQNIMHYWENNASFPYKSHDLWFLTENQRWGMMDSNIDVKTAINNVNRADLWREAAKEMNIPVAQIPPTDSRGVETFFDGVKFDPENTNAYLNSLKIKAI